MQYVRRTDHVDVTDVEEGLLVHHVRGHQDVQQVEWCSKSGILAALIHQVCIRYTYHVDVSGKEEGLMVHRVQVHGRDLQQVDAVSQAY